MRIVFDTYAWIEYFEGSKKGEVVTEYLEKSNKIYTPLVVLLELSYKADKEKWDFKKLLNFIKIKSEIIGINETFVFSFGNLYNTLKKQNRGFGFVDAVILNTAILNEAKVLTGDKHFSKVDRAILL